MFERRRNRSERARERQVIAGSERTAHRLELVRRTTRDGEELVGESRAMQEIARAIARYARVDATVCLVGETGVGKGLVARLIHDNSRRWNGPFIWFDSGTIPESLWEAECFGALRGAYTGAVHRVGLFRQAQGGTLFIDEVQDVGREVQGKLQRFLETHQVRPVGGERWESVDVRVIVGMNRNPRQMVERGEFRRDLFRRLGRHVVWIPPLRERREDLPALVAYAVKRVNERYGMKVKGVTAEALAVLQGHGWPGNVGELMSVVEAAVVDSGEEWVGVEAIRRALTAWEVGDEDGRRPMSLLARVEAVGLRRAMEEVEREVIMNVLRAHGGRLRSAARALKLPRTTLWEKVRRYGLRAEGHGEGEE